MILACIVPRYITTKAVASHVKRNCEFNLDPPLFNVLYEVVDRLLRCQVHLIKVVGPGTLAHANEVNGKHHEMINQVLVQGEVKYTSCTKAVDEYQNWLCLQIKWFCLVHSHNSSVFKYIFFFVVFFVGANFNFLHYYHVFWYVCKGQHLLSLSTKIFLINNIFRSAFLRDL
jgi:hypothetical protein